MDSSGLRLALQLLLTVDVGLSVCAPAVLVVTCSVGKAGNTCNLSIAGEMELAVSALSYAFSLYLVDREQSAYATELSH